MSALIEAHAQRDKQTTGFLRLVLFTLAAEANGDGAVGLEYRRLCQIANMGPDSFERNVEKLHQMGLLWHWKRAKGIDYAVILVGCDAPNHISDRLRHGQKLSGEALKARVNTVMRLRAEYAGQQPEKPEVKVPVGADQYYELLETGQTVPTHKHPAVNAWRAALRRTPNKQTWVWLAEAFGEKVNDKLLAYVVGLWRADGRNPHNYRGVANWYKSAEASGDPLKWQPSRDQKKAPKIDAHLDLPDKIAVDVGDDGAV